MIPPILTGAMMIIAAILTLASEYRSDPTLGAFGVIFVVGFVASQWKALPKPGKGFAIGAFVLVGVSFLHDDPVALIVTGFERGVFMCAFLIFLGFIRAAADDSTVVRRCGEFLLSQKPSARYTAFWTGGTLFGAIISVGSLNLFGSMVGAANTLESAGGDERIRKTRGKRSTLALMRGFTSSLLWSPMSITLAVVLKSLPGVRWPWVLTIGAGIALTQLLTGWLIDRLSHPQPASGVAVFQSTERWTVFLFPACLIGIIFLFGSELESRFDVTLATGVMTSAPLVTIAWLLMQGIQRSDVSPLPHAGQGLGRFLKVVVPGYRMEVTILSTAGFAGAVIASFLTPEMIASALTWSGAPALLVPAIVIGLVIAGGLLGLNAIITVMILGGALPDPAVFGVSPIILATSYLAAWGLTVGSSPVAMSTLIIGNFNQQSGATVGLRWNGIYTLSGYVVSSVILGTAVAFGAFM
jgi:hypothetical protein